MNDLMLILKQQILIKLFYDNNRLILYKYIKQFWYF